jgi:hypothetical protein
VVVPFAGIAPTVLTLCEVDPPAWVSVTVQSAPAMRPVTVAV